MPAPLDPFDARIVQALSEDGGLSNAALAVRAGLSPSAVSRRRAELRRSGVILGTRAVIDPAHMGGGFTAYVTVGLNEHSKEAQEGFERAVSAAPEVRECHNITGAVEYLLRVEVPDLAAYKTWHTDRLGTLPQVRTITTHVVMGSPKDLRA